MRRYLRASHGKMADGIRTTVEIIMGEQENLFCISAYTENCKDPMPEFQKVLGQYPKDDIVIMTDLPGGSVNNQAMALMSESRVYVVTGISLPLVIGILMSDMEEDTDKIIREAVAEAKEAMVDCEMVEGDAVEEEDF